MSDQVVRSLDAGAPGSGGMTVVRRGDVPGGATSYALERLGVLIEHIGEPVLFARVKLSMAPDPARDRPAIAEVAVDVDGELVRAHIAAHSMYEAIDLLQRRLRDKLEHRAQHRGARRKRSGIAEPGEWRHGDLPSERPDWFDRPTEERQVVRHKTFAVAGCTPDEAVFDMEQADFDFYLFSELATGEDAFVERQPDGGYRLTRLAAAAANPGPTAVCLTVSEHPAPQLTVGDAIERLEADGERYVFFADRTTGRGTVIYHRYDGDYGLITPE